PSDRDRDRCHVGFHQAQMTPDQVGGRGASGPVAGAPSCTGSTGSLWPSSAPRAGPGSGSSPGLGAGAESGSSGVEFGSAGGGGATGSVMSAFLSLDLCRSYPEDRKPMLENR